MTTPRPRSALLDFGLLLARLVVGGTFIMHGGQKFNQMGVPGTSQMLTGLGAPYPQISAWLLIGLEIGGGALLILGLLVRVLGLLFAVDMAGALLFVHLTHGFFITGGGNGFELVLLLGVIGLMFLCTGGGRYGIDGAFVRRRRERIAEKQVLDERELEPAV